MIDFTSDDFKEKEIILNYLKDEFDKDPDNGIDDERIAVMTGIKQKKINSHCAYLKQEGYLREWNRAGNTVWYNITSKGIDATQKDYCTTYQKVSLQEQLNDSLTKKIKDIETKLIEQKRHYDNLNVQKESNKWAKWGVIGAIVVSSIGIVISILAYLKG